jgi:hypothetical protein
MISHVRFPQHSDAPQTVDFARAGESRPKENENAMQAALIWVKHSNNYWHKLLDVDPEHVNPYGVYVVWHGGFPSRVVHVGHGHIGTELKACRRNRRVRAYERDGPLFVTWAATSFSEAAGIRLHLANRFRPLIDDAAPPELMPLVANAPF